jgi:NAD(P)-dependent dehydrogenase (short-subunit alcohol dehydrogenase family)
MRDFTDRIAVVTGGGTGMGRELAGQLAAAGCHVAMCDVSADAMEEARRLALAGAPAGVRVTTHVCDVADERQVLAFRDAAAAAHATDRVHLLFNNAGIGGGASFVEDDRAEWERTFGVCWYGVYYCTRAFLPLLVASDEACIVNTSSVNGFWACLGPRMPHTAYSTAKFAVKGFSEALLVDLRVNAPHVKVALVMPGHVGTSIVLNTSKVLGRPDALSMPAEELARLRSQLVRRGMPMGDLDDEQLRAVMHQLAIMFRDAAPTTAAEAARIILDGVRDGRWRILVGADAEAIDGLVRQAPERAYEPAIVEELQRLGHFRGVS